MANRIFAPKRLQSMSLRAVRSAANVPNSWRVLVLALLIGLVTQISPAICAVLAIIGLTFVWNQLTGLASTRLTKFEGSMNRSSMVGSSFRFASTMLAYAGLLLLAFEPFTFLLQESASRQLVLSFIAVGAIMLAFILMSAQAWRIGYAITVGAVTILTLTGGIWLAMNQTPETVSWTRTFARLLIVYLGAELLTPAFTRRGYRTNDITLGGTLRTLTLLLMLAMVNQPASGAKVRLFESYADILTVGLVSLGVAWILWSARIPLLMDWRWSLSRSRGPIPTSLGVSLGFLPALGLASFASWPAWTFAFSLGVAVAVFSLLAGVGSHRSSPPAFSPPTSAPAPIPAAPTV